MNHQETIQDMTRAYEKLCEHEKLPYSQAVINLIESERERLRQELEDIQAQLQSKPIRL